MALKLFLTGSCLSLLLLSVPSARAQEKSRAQKEVEEHLKVLQSRAKAPERVKAIARIAELEGVKKGAAKDAVPAVCKALRDTDNTIRIAAAEAVASLAQSGYSMKDYVKDLNAMVNGVKEKREVRVAAIIALGYLGKEASGSVPMLKDLHNKEKAKDEKMDREMFQMLNQTLQRLRASGAGSQAPMQPMYRLALLGRFRELEA